MTMQAGIRATCRLAALMAAASLCAFGAATEANAIAFHDAGARVHEPVASPGAGIPAPPGAPVRQAGAHPDLTFDFNSTPRSADPAEAMPLEMPHRLFVDLPLGLVGNPRATSVRCSEAGIKAGPNGNSAICPVASQVGTVDLLANDGGPSIATALPVYNVEPRAGTPGQFAFNALGAVIRLTPSVRGGDFGITVDSGIISQALPIARVRLTMWGVPYDPVHDNLRYGEPMFAGLPMSPPASVPGVREPFLSLPTRCDAAPDRTVARLDGWESIGQFATTAFTDDLDGVPFVTTGCENVPFDAEVDVGPTARAADAPTGLEVDLRVPQTSDPGILSTSHVKDVAMALPVGMSVSPSSAAGLGACSPAQINLASSSAPDCPRSSKLGTVTVESPLIEEPMTGDVILATPDQNPFGSLVALYIVAEGSGVRIKLPGRVDPNPVTGQLTATFSNNPQLPFSRLRVRFDGGPNAPLATPTKCGRYETKARVTSWSGQTLDLTSPMVVDQNCTPSPRGFALDMHAGSVTPLAAQDSAFVLNVNRSDGQQNLGPGSIVMPPGMLARIGDIDLCAERDAAAGSCNDNSLIGAVRVTAGPGSAPLPVRGKLFLTGPYKGAPFGLSVVVPTAGQSGPFDLGNVVVRARISVDRTDGHVTVVEDPMPTILRGFPLRIRQIQASIDHGRFMINPSSCDPMGIRLTRRGTEGGVFERDVPYRVSGCGDLKQDQKIRIGFTNKTQQRPGRHPGVEAKMTSKGPGGANLKKVVVKLPLSVALDPQNAKALCKPDQRAALDCPKDSIVGRASAKSVLKEELTGPIYFVEGTRKTKQGRVVPTLPKLWIPLSGGGVTIDVNADSHVSRRKLVSTFKDLPDAPITEFKLRINSGRNGILKIPPSKDGGTCQRDRTVHMQLTGQNGAVKTVRSKVKVAGCKTKSSKKTSSKASKKSTKKAARKK